MSLNSSIVFKIAPRKVLKNSMLILSENIYLGLGFEFGPQRIRDLEIVCP